MEGAAPILSYPRLRLERDGKGLWVRRGGFSYLVFKNLTSLVSTVQYKYDGVAD